MSAVGAFWPRSLAVRLCILLVIALGAAQLMLTLLLNRERDSVVEELIHGQALNQTVTLARLLNENPLGATAGLVASFQSRGTCAVVTSTSVNEPMSAPERQLADTLRAMLHGNTTASPPRVHIIANRSPHAICNEDRPADSNSARRPFSAGPGGDDDGADSDGDGDQFAALVMDVPLLGNRWLRFVTGVDLPVEPNKLSLISFVVSSIAVALVAIWVVRTQTGSLRSLADASERFGRGESVSPLPINGPSEVSKATAAFNVMQARLTQFMRDRIQLLASISHDLRTPLTTLRLKAEFIDDETVRDDLVRTIDEMTAICEATLAFTYAEAAAESTVELNLADLVGELISDYRLADANVTAGLTDQVVLACRPIALRRALRNLIENAVGYGGSAQVAVIADGDEAVVRVDDNGPGIPLDRMDEAFKPFVRLEPSRSSETGGIGLGLAVAQGIVHAHGGTLTLANRPEGGLRAEVRLQRNRQSSPTTDRRESPGVLATSP